MVCFLFFFSPILKKLNIVHRAKKKIDKMEGKFSFKHDSKVFNIQPGEYPGQDAVATTYICLKDYSTFTSMI